MAPDEWQELETAFREATTLPAPERDRFVERFAERYPALAPRLRGMLTADTRDDDLLQGRIDASVRTLVGSNDDPWIGRQVGAWKITRRIAAGGMGAVFVAERADAQFEQVVALKIMSAQLLAPDSVARFKSERQILATLNHPYIAQLHDGGTTDDGLPYLVMEYVDGLPIDSYCERHALDVSTRLQLFRKVCTAVDYAHRNLTVHRDLKPSNILIDTQGNPKLLDFGIAKLLRPEVFDLTQALTRPGTRAMTPEYASPEQVRGDAISVATDVYSLGVLLYRLLTGTSPYGELSSPLEYERAIVEHEPRRPSTSVTRPQSEAMAGTATHELRNALVGDLDNIVLMALQKEPEQRYASVSDLSADIGRHLRHEPVAARAATWPYLTSKFVHRNARGLSIAAAVVIGIAMLVTFYTLELASERDRANLSARQASEVSAFLTDIFESASPLDTPGENLSAVDLLERGSERVAALSGQPAVQAELYRIIGWSYSNLGEYERAMELLQRSVDLRAGDDSVDPSALAVSVENLAETNRKQRNYDAAVAGYRRALELRQAIHGLEHAEVARVLGELGGAYGSANRSEKALETYREALAMKRRLGDEPDSATADILGGIATELDDLGRYDAAARTHREAIAISEVVNGPLHPYTIIRRSNLGFVLHRQFRYEEADASFAETIARARRTWPSGHPRLAYYVQAHGQVLVALGRFDEALPLLEEAASMAQALDGERSFSRAGALYGLSTWYTARGRFDEAGRLLDEARDVAVDVDGPNGYLANVIDFGIAGNLIAAKHWVEAELPLRRIIGNPQSTSVYTDYRARAWLALACAKQGRREEARRRLGRALTDATGNDEASMISLYTIATEALRDIGSLDQSLEHGERVHQIVSGRLPPGNWIAAQATEQYARSLLAADRMDEARPLLLSVRESYQRVFGPEDHRTVALSALL